MIDQFRFDRDQTRRLALFLNVEVGTHLTHAELMDHHHAVIYAHGAATDRRLGIAGEDLPSSLPATRFVAWYNDHPDHARLDPDLHGRRAVIIGNGNVALDIARLLATDPDRLAETDIADHALNALQHSTIEEVVIVGRRSAADAAFTTPELLALTQRTDVDVVLDKPITAEEAAAAVGAAARHKLALLTALPTAEQDPVAGRKRIVLRFNSTPMAIVGSGDVDGIVLAATETRVDPDGIRQPVVGDHTETLPTQLVIRSIGFKGSPLPDIPFDDSNGTVPNQAGRVTESASQQPLPGVYTAGWIKRGPTGVIGTNRLCAQETVANLLDDFLADRLVTPRAGTDQLTRLVRSRQPDTVDSRGWSAIDTAERSAGAATQRPRRKFINRDELLDTARPRPTR